MREHFLGFADSQLMVQVPVSTASQIDDFSPHLFVANLYMGFEKQKIKWTENGPFKNKFQ